MYLDFQQMLYVMENITWIAYVLWSWDIDIKDKHNKSSKWNMLLQVFQKYVFLIM